MNPKSRISNFCVILALCFCGECSRANHGHDRFAFEHHEFSHAFPGDGAQLLCRCLFDVWMRNALELVVRARIHRAGGIGAFDGGETLRHSEQWRRLLFFHRSKVRWDFFDYYRAAHLDRRARCLAHLDGGERRGRVQHLSRHGAGEGIGDCTERKPADRVSLHGLRGESGWNLLLCAQIC